MRSCLVGQHAPQTCRRESPVAAGLQQDAVHDVAAPQPQPAAGGLLPARKGLSAPLPRLECGRRRPEEPVPVNRSTASAEFWNRAIPVPTVSVQPWGNG